GHSHNGRLVQAEHEAEVVRQPREERDLGGAGVGEDRREAVLAERVERRVAHRAPAHGTSTARPRMAPSRSIPRTSLIASSGCVCTRSVTRPAACSWISSYRSVQLPTRLPTTDFSSTTRA